MEVHALVYDHKVLWLSAYSCKGPGMDLFRTEGLLVVSSNTHFLRTASFKTGEDEIKSKLPEIPSNISWVSTFLTKV
jgi:hypothetical protein